MALITCNNCGKPLSDRATQCPHCGITIKNQEFEDTRVMNDNSSYYPQSDDRYLSYDDSSHNKPGTSGNNGLKVMASVLAVLAVLALIGCGWFIYDRNQRQRMEQERLAQLEQDRQEQARQDSIAAAEQARLEAERAEQARQDSIRDLHNAIIDAYIGQLRALRNSDEGNNGGDYFLYDITGDGVPEIWMRGGYGYCETNIYTYTNGSLRNIGMGAGRHATYHRGNGYVIENFCLQGGQKIDKLTYNGSKVVATTIYEEYPVEDYKGIDEPAFNDIPLTDEGPIRAIFPQ